MYSPPSSSQSRTSIAKGIPLCKHGVHAKLQVVKKGTRVGERFYGCAFWPAQDCKFFKWEKDVEYTSEISSCLEEEKAMLIGKIRKLKAKNAKLKESEAMLKLKVVEYVNAQKALSFVLVASWVLFVLFLFMLS
ncbi:uncharacterized protein LOC130803694 [Amaranthus tricolor]|uniref:uncharacterized protein LOC130803694 n=1 Tax=Amaranthus tricolor TaxID=29722 RepID=UPI002582E38E|nr:uncharacterized protein LOC130803694 [Amaranthus tricolor]